MIRHVGTLSVYVLATLLGAGLFFTSQHVQIAERDLSALRAIAAAKHANLKILRAEWTYLNRPDRLEKLAAAYLDLGPAAPKQIYTALSDVPTAPMFRAAPIAPAPVQVAAAAKDDRDHDKDDVAQNDIVAPNIAKIAAAIAPSTGSAAETGQDTSFAKMMARVTEKGVTP